MNTDQPSPCCAASRKPVEEDTAVEVQVVCCSTQAAAGGMVRFVGGSFRMGTDASEGFPADGEGPVREVRVNPFYIDTQAVTNADFVEFVEATGYETEAEQYGWSFVFYSFSRLCCMNRVIQVV